MDESRFDALTRMAGRDRSRRTLLGAALASAVAGVAAFAPGLSLDSAAKKKKKKKRCKKDGAACKSDKQCCTSKTKRICDVPHNAGNGDTACCGGQGAVCGGVNADGDQQPPFCCVGEAGERAFECSASDPTQPGVKGVCQPSVKED